MGSETLPIAVALVLLVFSLVIKIVLIFNAFKSPHKHKFYTHDYPCVRYASCSCGARIEIDKAIKTNVPIYSRETGERMYWIVEK